MSAAPPTVISETLHGPKLGLVITRWFAIIFLVLYVASATVVVWIEDQHAIHDLEVLLYAEAEGFASFYAGTGSLDFPELAAEDAEAPMPVWLRLVENGEITVETPGLPALVVATEPILNTLVTLDDEHLAVRHNVHGHPDAFVEAISTHKALRHRHDDIILALTFTGLGLMPFAALGGLLLARRTTRPISALIRDIDSLDSEVLDQRLRVPANAPHEVGALATAFDELMGRLHATVERQRRFTADASHELRTPIAVIRSGLEVALRRPRDAEDYQIVIDDTLRHVERVQRIVESLLALARGQADAEAREVLKPANLVHESIDTLQPLADEKNVAIETDLDPDVTVEGHPELLRLLVNNLLDNAIRHTPASSRVFLSVDQLANNGSSQVRMRVRDEGPGVPPAKREEIFQRFHAGDDGRAGGIGLDLVRWVTQRHRGEVEVVDSPHSGAVFEVRLPHA
ncbi:MAG: HAMP domain-containing sensor histidine kinase [Acidobacteriota bacterium]